MEDMEYDFSGELDACLEKALELKSKEPKNERTRYWAVIFTELEKINAYYQTYIAKGDSV